MQTIGEIANKHTYKNKKSEEKQMDINVIPNNIEKYMAFMLSFDRFTEKKLPVKDDIYSILNNENISNMQYMHALKSMEYI